MGAVRSHDIAHYINQSSGNQQPSRYAGEDHGHESHAAASHQEQQHPSPSYEGSNALSSLDAQLRSLRKELKAKDDKLARVTEHSMMQASHMDRLRGEVALLTQRLRDSEMELEVRMS